MSPGRTEPTSGAGASPSPPRAASSPTGRSSDARSTAPRRRRGGAPPPGALPDFFFVGPLFATRSHPSVAAAAPGLIAAVRAVRPGVPQLGIGGVTPGRAGSVRGAGAHGVAVIRAVWAAADPAGALARLIHETYAGSPPAAGG